MKYLIKQACILLRKSKMIHLYILVQIVIFSAVISCSLNYLSYKRVLEKEIALQLLNDVYIIYPVYFDATSSLFNGFDFNDQERIHKILNTEIKLISYVQTFGLDHQVYDIVYDSSLVPDHFIAYSDSLTDFMDLKLKYREGQLYFNNEAKASFKEFEQKNSKYIIDLNQWIDKQSLLILPYQFKPEKLTLSYNSLMINGNDAIKPNEIKRVLKYLNLKYHTEFKYYNLYQELNRMFEEDSFVIQYFNNIMFILSLQLVIVVPSFVLWELMKNQYFDAIKLVFGATIKQLVIEKTVFQIIYMTLSNVLGIFLGCLITLNQIFSLNSVINYKPTMVGMLLPLLISFVLNGIVILFTIHFLKRIRLIDILKGK